MVIGPRDPAHPISGAATNFPLDELFSLHHFVVRLQIGRNSAYLHIVDHRPLRAAGHFSLIQASGVVPVPLRIQIGVAVSDELAGVHVDGAHSRHRVFRDIE